MAIWKTLIRICIESRNLPQRLIAIWKTLIRIRIDSRNLPQGLMLNLFYPAVLASITYSSLHFIIDYKHIWQNIMPFLIIICILIHFTLDFIETSTIPEYNINTFVIDCFGLFFLYLAFHFVNYLTTAPNYKATALSLGFLYICYLLFDLILHNYPYFKKASVTSLLLFVSFFIVRLCPPSRLLIRPERWIIILLLLASIRLVWLIYKDVQTSVSTYKVSADTKEAYTVSAATKEDICWVTDTARRIYPKSDVISTELKLEWFYTNPTGFFIIKDSEGNRCGNLDILPLKPDTLACFLSGELIEREIHGDCLFQPHELNQIDSLYIESFVALTKNDKANPVAAYKCVMRIPELIRYICVPSQIKKIYAVGTSQSGIRLLKNLGFDRIKNKNERRDGHQVFSISFLGLAKNIAAHAEGEDKLKFQQMMKDIGGN